MISEQEILNASILIVDDERISVHLLEETLRAAGYSCIASTTDAHSVCCLHRKNRYDLILLDLSMPDMDGFQVMEGLKQIETDDYLPVLVITAQPDHKLRALAAGAKDFVTKPFDMAEVQRRIHNMLEVRLLNKKLVHHNKALEQMVLERSAELRETGTLLRRNQTLMQNSMDGIHVMDMLGNIVEANDAFCHMLGYTRAEMARLNVADWDAQWSAEELKDRFKELIGKSARFETVHRRRDGSLINVEISTSGMEIEKQCFLFAASRDITGRKQADNALRESQQKLKLFIEGAPTGIAAFDTEMRYLALSERFMKQFRVADTDVIGRSHYEIFPEIPEHWRDIHRRCLAGETLSCDKDPFHRADGSVDWVRWEMRPWRDISGKIGGIICFTDDVTESIRVEQELIFLNNQLTHEVSKRTADLSALTAHIQNIAETEKASLARELHDELGSTLVGISMELGRLRGKITSADHLQDLSVIKDLTSSASQITRGVVDQLYPRVLDDYGYVAAVEWLVSEYRKHSGIAVELILPTEEVVMEHTFSLAAYRITQECLTNIAKHSGASQVHIEAKTCDGFLDLAIHDNGKGLSGGTNAGGHGIFGMIERARFLGGSMEIASQDGKGTTACLRIPLAIARPKNKKRVLVVDDHSIIRDAIRQLLDSQTDDFSVEGEAADGMAAIQMAIEGVWDIMLLDINLPKKSGLKVLEEIIAVKSGLPIIMLSSHAEEQYGEIALSKGAACYIEKGETSKLVDAMRRATLLQ